MNTLLHAVRELAQKIAPRFVSGNSVPVERAHITAAEFQELQSLADRAEAESQREGQQGQWQLVPKVATPEMIEAGVRAGVFATPKPWCPETWAAMLKAAPPPPEPRK